MPPSREVYKRLLIGFRRNISIEFIAISSPGGSLHLDIQHLPQAKLNIKHISLVLKATKSVSSENNNVNQENNVNNFQSKTAPRQPRGWFFLRVRKNRQKHLWSLNICKIQFCIFPVSEKRKAFCFLFHQVLDIDNYTWELGVQWNYLLSISVGTRCSVELSTIYFCEN